jgi:hypothetical protein
MFENFKKDLEVAPNNKLSNAITPKNGLQMATPISMVHG